MGDPDGSAFRRRLVVIVTGATGAAVLARGLRTHPGSSSFYVATSALAAVWFVGGMLAGPMHLGWTVRDGRLRRPIIGPIVVGAGLAAVFVAGALIVRHVAFLADRIEDILAYERRGSRPGVLALTVANGVAEEVYFRGALQPSLPERLQLPATVAIYALITIGTGNFVLGAASVLLGIIVGLQRRATDGILAPALTHVTWSVLMFVLLPVVFR